MTEGEGQLRYVSGGVEAALEALLSTPAPAVVELMRRLEGDLLILGVAGKMGVTLALQAVRAAREAGVRKRVVGVARFSQAGVREQLEAGGVETIACDLLEAADVARLPRLANVIFMAGRKFGTAGDEALTWAMNTGVAMLVGEQFAASRIVVFSTGCVYPLRLAEQGGADETTPPAPVGEYAQSCLGRERIFQAFSQRRGTRVCLFRLNYALDLRYGVLHDLAQTILAGQPVDLGVSHFNAIWQGDANAQALLALELAASPAAVLNVTGPETVCVRETALALGRLLGREVSFRGTPGQAYLSDARVALARFGPPRVPVATLIRWQAVWLLTGGRSLGKPTHFDVSNGQF